MKSVKNLKIWKNEGFQNFSIFRIFKFYISMFSNFQAQTFEFFEFSILKLKSEFCPDQVQTRIWFWSGPDRIQMWVWTRKNPDSGRNLDLYRWWTTLFYSYVISLILIVSCPTPKFLISKRSWISQTRMNHSKSSVIWKGRTQL